MLARMITPVLVWLSLIICPPAGVLASGVFEPNDPYFHRDTPSSGFRGQWYLKNEWSKVDGMYIDVNVWPVWQRGITGAGVNIAIVDSTGVEYTHPDLAANYIASMSWDFMGNDSDSAPGGVTAPDAHGTACAGVAAAVGGNGIGVTGAAPGAHFAALKIDLSDKQTMVDALNYKNSGTNSGIQIKSNSWGAMSMYSNLSTVADAFAASTQAGCIEVLAAGNSRTGAAPGTGTNMLMNLPHIIGVAAMNSSGYFSSYSCYGANLFVTAPSGNNSTSMYRVTTTDITGNGGLNGTNEINADSFPDLNYTSIFDGTSSSTPLVAGVLALAKQVNSNLDTRMAKHILAKTSRIVDPNNSHDSYNTGDGGWRTNHAGYHFNQNYGFGLVDADAVVTQAALFRGVTPLKTETTGTIAVGRQFTKASPLSIPFTISHHTPLEEVLVHVDMTSVYNYTGMGISVVSPLGYESRLIQSVASSFWTKSSHIWTYETNALWGEDPFGTWYLEVWCDSSHDCYGTLNNFQVTVNMGELTTVPEPATMCLLALGGLALLRGRRRR